MKKLLRIISIVTALMLFVPYVAENNTIFQSYSVSAEDGATSETTAAVTTENNKNNEEKPAEDFVEPEYVSNFTLPEDLRAVTLTPRVDFAQKPEQSQADIQAQLNSIMDDIVSKSMNAVIVNTSYNSETFYNTDINDTVEKTPVELAVQTAKDKGLSVYLVFDMNIILTQFKTEPLQERIDYLALKAHTFTVKHRVDGIILNGYYSSKNRTSFDDYMVNGSGIGFENWLLDNGAYVFSLVSDAIRKTNNTVPVGIYLHDAWSNYSTNPDGSKTNDPFQALTDGYSDTLGYVKNGYADFIMLEAEGSIADTSIPFNEFVGWWAKAAVGANIPLYVMHDNDKICTQAAGWAYPDQIIHQMRSAKSVAGYKGSAFSSYTALAKDSEGSTTALVKYYNDQLNMETIDNELTIISPQKRTFTTEEPTIAFMGTFDPNFTVYFNGQVIKLNDAGNFYYEEELDVGLNTFTIKNKGKTIVYNITRKVQVLKSIDPASDLEVEGQSNIVITAVAYKGSTVNASINGKKVSLKPTEGQIEGLENSNYIRYIGTYTAPKGIINKAQNLGRVVVYGSYPGKNGKTFNEQITGGNVTVNALPEVPNNADGSLLKVRNNNTMVYDYRTTNSEPSPNQARLPAGVLDYCVKKVTYSNISYYLTLSGKRIKCTDVEVLDNAPIGINHIQPVSAAIEGNDTVLRFKQNAKTPFSMSLGNVSYSAGSNGNYNVSGFSANSIKITFDYTNSVNGTLSLPGGGLFSDCSWDESTANDITKQTLTLNFSRSGIFRGVTASYDGDGNLVFRFKGYSSGLSGTVVVLDPGHGITATGKTDPGAIGHITEQSVLPPIAKLVESKLRAKGATVYRLNTESQFYDTEQRSSVARQYDPDIFIAIHANKSSSSARGTEAWYFTPWSQPLASSVSSSVAQYFASNVYADGRLTNRGAKYNVFWVTLQQDFASILLETAFVSNYEDAMAMSNPNHQNGIADAIVRGIENYLSR
ncbi:MAG TPA: N-acetylmuramoyl-L-alanine amidase [Oscillospiraceae bacterium]|nr:N-acetylmuramoyl-L-alanine amidase [Oscillospiraceae bacterium]